MPKPKPGHRSATRSGSGRPPDRFDVVWLDFDPQAGREQRGRRPAYVLTPRAYNERSGLCLACPMTNQVKGYPFEVAMPSGAEVGGVILVDHLTSVSWEARRAEVIGNYPEVADEVLAKLGALLGG